MKWRTFPWLLAVLLIGAVPRAAQSQSSLDPGQLPKSTVFYLAWHGAPAGDTRKANSLLALWDDPDFTPVRAAIIEEMVSDSAPAKKTRAAITRDELAQYGSLLDNEFVVGYLGKPNAAKSAEPDSVGDKWNGMFLVYDRTGKETTLTKLLVQMRKNEKDPPEISATSIAGIPAIKVVRKTGTSYWAEDGSYAFTASDPAVFAQVGAWARHTAPADGGLSQTAEYHEAIDLLKGGVLELFFRFSSIKEIAPDSNAGGFRLRPLLRGLRLETVHSIVGHLMIDGARTRMQGAILGDASAGTLFDIWDAGTDAPASMKFVNATTVSYQTSQINLLGIYELIKRALRSSVGDGQSNPAESVETIAKMRLGMPLPEALGLFSGEFATLQSSTTLDPAKQVYMMGIRKKPETLKMLRTGLGDYLSGEQTEGDTTYLKISEGGIHSDAGTASWKYKYLAVTPDAIVYSNRRETVRELLATRKSASDSAAGLPQAWQAAREQFPKTINGLSFLDLQQVDWTALKERWNTESRKASPGAKTAQKMPQGALSNALEQLSPQVFQRHLHLTASGSWKDAQGVHVDGWIE